MALRFFQVIFDKYVTCDILPDVTRYYLLKFRNITRGINVKYHNKDRQRRKTKIVGSCATSNELKVKAFFREKKLPCIETRT